FIAFGSDNVDSALAAAAMVAVALAAVVAFVTVLSGLWRRRISLPRAWLATLMMVTVAGKVFSAQYLIWLLPIMAVAVSLEGFTPLAWLGVCALTTFSYPFLWRSPHGAWHVLIALRNITVLTLLAGLLPAAEWARWWQAARQAIERRPWRRL